MSIVSKHSWLFRCLLLVALCMLGSSPAAQPSAAWADAPANKVLPSIAEVIANLNSDQFEVRRRASEVLHSLADRPEAQAELAIALERLLLSPETPYEVRALCEPLMLRLPAPDDASQPEPTLEDIDQLLRNVDAPSYGQRVGAAVRLKWIATRSARLAEVVAARLKRPLADPQLTTDSRRRLAQVREAAWLSWLASDPAGWTPPQATDHDVQQWLDTLTSASASNVAQEAALRELTDLVVVDAWAPKLRTVVEERLKDANLPPEAIERLTLISDLTRPAMAAEIWEDRQNHTLQYLLVDVPQFPDQAPRATHFSQIDDNTAHCVSGNSLASGDYPVGVAIPVTHPLAEYKETRMFQLVNLPNARRRLLYDRQQLKVEEAKRLRGLSERTTAWFTNQKRCLTEREIALLRQLDGATVSRFAGPYLLSIDDQPKVEPEEFPFGGRNSRHALLCAVLIESGTHEALADLTTALEKDRLPKPSEDLRYHVGWVAAFAIAERDPWPGLDAWLASLLDKGQTISTASDPPPEVGATAAAILLVRHGAATADFGVLDVNDQDLRGLGIPASRFSTPAARQQVIEWWQREKAKPKAAGA